MGSPFPSVPTVGMEPEAVGASHTSWRASGGQRERKRVGLDLRRGLLSEEIWTDRNIGGINIWSIPLKM